ncbi:MAG: hypothetical protein XXXJIFNMEKO3_00453 [Candidatus Erwinia impunctatus]|nr:hypothetical protein XXXJIFNMEKO_00453 [Culicoides impunctatus]
MKRLSAGLFCLMVFSSPLFAAEAPSHQNGSSAQESYHSGMHKMNQDMMAGMANADPDIAFAEGMTAHHQGAIDMAKTELKYGKDPAMRKLAEEIIKAQQPEIDRMQAWLAEKRQ